MLTKKEYKFWFAPGSQNQNIIKGDMHAYKKGI